MLESLLVRSVYCVYFLRSEYTQPGYVGPAKLLNVYGWKKNVFDFDEWLVLKRILALLG